MAKTAFKLAVVLGLTLSLQAAQSPPPSQRTFSTPQEAVQATIDASEKNDTPALLQLFGANSKSIVESGDLAEDKSDRAEFARLGHEKVQVNQDPTNPNVATFSVGNQ